VELAELIKQMDDYLDRLDRAIAKNTEARGLFLVTNAMWTLIKSELFNHYLPKGVLD